MADTKTTTELVLKTKVDDNDRQSRRASVALGKKMGKAIGEGLRSEAQKEIDRLQADAIKAIERRRAAISAKDPTAHVQASEEVRELRKQLRGAILRKQQEDQGGASPYAQRYAHRAGGLIGRALGMPLQMSGLGQTATAAGEEFSALGIGGLPLALGAGGLALGGYSIMQAMARNRAAKQAAGVLGGAGDVRALFGRGSRYGMSDEEYLGEAAGVARATGTASGTDAVLNAKYGYGLGSESVGLLGSMSRQMGKAGSAEQQARLIGQAIGVAAGSQLERGRFGEVMEGLSAIINRSGLGITPDVGKAGGLYAALGAGDQFFRGQGGFQMIGAMDALARGQAGSPLGRGISLLAAGLGRPGTSYADALMNQEMGLFGTYGDLAGTGGRRQWDKTAGVPRFQALLKGYEGIEDPGTRRMLMAQDLGLPQAAVERLMKLGPGLTEAAFKKETEAAKPIQDQAAQAILNAFNGTDAPLKQIQSSLATIGDTLLPAIIPPLQAIATALAWLVGKSETPSEKAWLGAAQPDGATPGDSSTIVNSPTPPGWLRGGAVVSRPGWSR